MGARFAPHWGLVRSTVNGLMSIRVRLTLLYASLLAIAMLVFSIATLSVLNWTLRRQVDASLQKAAEDIQAEGVISAMPTVGGDRPHVSELIREFSMLQVNSLDAPGLFVQIWLYDPSIERLYLHDFSWNLLGVGYSGALDPLALGVKAEVRRDCLVNGHHLRVFTRPLALNGQVWGYIQVATSLNTVDAAIDRLLRIMVIGGAVTLFMALALGDYLTRRALRPIDVIAQTARQITAADDLSRRIPYDGPPDELGQLTRIFNKTLERLERLFNVQRRFVADVSHEMRTPLTIIRGNVDLMRRYGYDEEAMEAIESEARRMSRLVDDLLLLAKADAGRLTLNKEVVSLDTLVLEVYNQARMFSEEVRVELGKLDQAYVLGDADRLKQLLLNLVTNGVKYTSEGGRVTLSLARENGWAYVRVEDTGIGIPTEDLPHIFTPFYRVDHARSRAKGGTGLGLSIVRWIVEAHNGRITVESEVGQGSVFTVALPLVPKSTAQDAKRTTQANLQAVHER